MQNNTSFVPRQFPGVMISSTFTDLKDHRGILINVLKSHGLTDIAMENDSAKLADVIDSSLQMVRDASAYIGVIGHKYGQTPECPKRNPDKLSITELEFLEAQTLGRPILLFIMGEGHPLHKADVETDPDKLKKLNAFREQAKQMKQDSPDRVYATFNSLEEFTLEAFPAVANLRRYLDEQGTIVTTKPDPDPIPKPPAIYAEPPYVGSHKFIGRQAQLDVLSDWAVPADAHPVLLFDAIGGSGKSILTWEWTTKYATQVRGDWAGCFWYSFYERGAIMADFCRHALAYITSKPLDDFRKIKTPELGERLLHHLQARPWLINLDGLERVLVAYHRFDAAQVPDEEANKPTDQIAHRDPCAAIRPEDDDLLRALAAAAPSKLLITSRLVPKVLLNPANQPIPGVLRASLPGLHPVDAESLLRNCGITGTSQEIQNYLKSHCDCHPLVTGVLAGLINDYLPNRGNFDAWAADPDGGGRLNLAKLDLIQKRNHILKTALDALPEKSRQILSTMALLSEAVDYPALSALNPHLPPGPEVVEDPDKTWHFMSEEEQKRANEAYNRMTDDQRRKRDEEKKQTQLKYQTARQRRKDYEQALKTWQQLPEVLTAPRKLVETVHDLEHRGLLQYDAQAKRHDLHPVIRSIAAGGLQPEETDRYGQRVVDHFAERPRSPYEQAETLDDLRNGLHVVRTLLKMGRYQQACNAYCSDLSTALISNLEAYVEVLSLLRPFFPHNWATLPNAVDQRAASYLANEAASALYYSDETEEAFTCQGAVLLSYLGMAKWAEVRNALSNISQILHKLRRLAKGERYFLLALDLAVLMDDKEAIFRTRLDRFMQLATIGLWTDAEALWDLLDPMGRNWRRERYSPGAAEFEYAQFCFWRGNLTEEYLTHAERLAREGKNRFHIRRLHDLRGHWRLEQGQWSLAAESLQEAIRMARAVGDTNAEAETQLILAKLRLGQLSDPRREAEQLSEANWVSYLALANLWFAIGNHEQATKWALKAYKWHWVNGEPYVHRYELNKARALLEQLGAEVPNLPRYDPAKDEKFPWEDKVVAAIEKLRAEKEAKDRKKD